MYRDIMDKLVVGALQKCGVDGHDGFQSLAREACCEGDGVLLCDAYVVITLWEALAKRNHARALPHGRCDAD